MSDVHFCNFIGAADSFGLCKQSQGGSEWKPRTNARGTHRILVWHVHGDRIWLGAAVRELYPLDLFGAVLRDGVGGRWEREVKNMYPLTRQLQVLDNLRKVDDLISKEIGEFLVGVSWDTQDEDVSDPGHVCIPRLCDAGSYPAVGKQDRQNLMGVGGRSGGIGNFPFFW